MNIFKKRHALEQRYATQAEFLELRDRFVALCQYLKVRVEKPYRCQVTKLKASNKDCEPKEQRGQAKIR